MASPPPLTENQRKRRSSVKLFRMNRPMLMEQHVIASYLDMLVVIIMWCSIACAALVKRRQWKENFDTVTEKLLQSMSEA